MQPLRNDLLYKSVVILMLRPNAFKTVNNCNYLKQNAEPPTYKTDFFSLFFFCGINFIKNIVRKFNVNKRKIFFLKKTFHI